MQRHRSTSQIISSWTRRLHYYLGLFVSPFLVIFAVSTILLNHGWRSVPVESLTTTPVQIDESLSGGQLVRDLARQLQLRGEIVGNGMVRNETTTFLVMRPGVTRRIVVNTRTGQAEIMLRSFGLLDTMRYLHMNPGPHKPANSFLGKAWGWLADVTVYLTLFLTVSGIYLWFGLRTERKAGLIAIGAGCLSFCAIVCSLLF